MASSQFQVYPRKTLATAAVCAESRLGAADALPAPHSDRPRQRAGGGSRPQPRLLRGSARALRLYARLRERRVPRLRRRRRWQDDEPLAFGLSGTPHAATHVAFTASSTDQLDPFHAAAVVADGRNNGAGERDS